MTYYQQAMGGSQVVINPLGGWGMIGVEGVYVSMPSDTVYAAGVSNDWWIKDPEAIYQAFIEPAPEYQSETPTTHVKVYLEGDDFDIDYEQDTYIFKPLNRELPVVEYGPRRGRKAKLHINIVGDEDYYRLMQLIGQSRTFALQSPVGWQIFFRVDDKRKETIRNTQDRYRLVELPIIEVAHPYA